MSFHTVTDRDVLSISWQTKGRGSFLQKNTQFFSSLPVQELIKNGRTSEVLFLGGKNTWKSYLADIFIAVASDEKAPENIPEDNKMSYEAEPSQATGSPVYEMETIRGQPTRVSYSANITDINEYKNGDLTRGEIVGEYAPHIAILSTRPYPQYDISGDVQNKEDFRILVDFDRASNCHSFTAHILNPSLQTPTVMRTLKDMGKQVKILTT